MIIDALHPTPHTPLPTPLPLPAACSLQLGVAGKYLISGRNNNMRQCTIVNLHTWTRACAQNSSLVSAPNQGCAFQQNQYILIINQLVLNYLWQLITKFGIMYYTSCCHRDWIKRTTFDFRCIHAWCEIFLHYPA